jgi:uncharacterized protein involved in response to NO
MATTQLMQIDETSAGERGFALWELGFRPFYLLASAFAAVSIALWGLQVSGWLGRPYLAGPLWHAHEMVFGFALAVIVGFLLTAGRNWTGLPTTSRLTLQLLVALWVAGRVLVLTPYAVAAAVVTTAFPVAAAAALAVPFARARNRRNYFFVGVLLLMAAADAAMHASALGALAPVGTRAIQVALGIVLFVMSVMAGRVVPMFTNNGVRGAHATRRPAVERLALGSVIALVAADALQAPVAIIAAITAIAAVAHAVRAWLWQPWTTLRTPLVWVLHAAYWWIPAYLVLRALATQGWVASDVATHALTVGAIGGLTIGMMTRTARGHTGRPLQADRWEVACYVAVLAAAVVRVVGPLALPEYYLASVLLAAACWSAGFGLYAVRYWPILTRSRLDGRPG